MGKKERIKREGKSEEKLTYTNFLYKSTEIKMNSTYDKCISYDKSRTLKRSNLPAQVETTYVRSLFVNKVGRSNGFDQNYLHK